ncbi:MAG: DNA-processing protein DprA, partial [Proteobacteria bacterium]|nr:DNA-processing protein DprA [Pseudomonadota bacterium]
MGSGLPIRMNSRSPPVKINAWSKTSMVPSAAVSGLGKIARRPEENSPMVAIVGTRGATTYGKAAAQKFAEAFARAGLTVVSGGAIGIDLHAHEGAIMITDAKERAAAALPRLQRLVDCRRDLEAAGLEFDITGAGATTTWDIAGRLEGITDAEAKERARDTVNHVKWLAGHLTSTRFSMGKLAGLQEQDPWSELFSHGHG